VDLKCNWCGETKDENEFVKRKAALPYSQSNVRNCKLCNSTRNRTRYKDPELRSKQLAANAKWRREHPDRQRYLEKEFSKRQPANQQARSRIGYLVRKGYLIRRPCEICGAVAGVEAHHDSYSEAHWEVVRWLCKEHHEKWHQILDPVKADLLGESLVEVEQSRDEADELMRQILALRKRRNELLTDAKHKELTAWNKVREVADHKFIDFASK
jgi:hypothetical protein